MPWYANQQIRQGTTLAYDVGHIVPPGNVDRHGYDTDGLVDWAEPGEHYQYEPQPSPQLGVFANAPVEEGTRDLTEADAKPSTVESVKPVTRSTSKPSDGATNSSEG